MKRRNKAKHAGVLVPPVSAVPDRMTNQFLRGFATTGLLLAVRPGGRLAPKALLHHALRGGAALAAGAAAANALDRRDYGGAAWSLAIGAAGIAAIDTLMTGACALLEKETEDGQEEAA